MLQEDEEARRAAARQLEAQQLAVAEEQRRLEAVRLEQVSWDWWRDAVLVSDWSTVLGPDELGLVGRCSALL